MKKILLMMLMIFITIANANSYKYAVKYHGVQLGEISDLSTIDKLYLKAKVTSRVARFMLGKDYLVYYGGNKPSISDAKYKKDKKMILYAFKTSITQKPKFKRFPISSVKDITLECKSANECRFEYHKNGKVNGKGQIRFDKNGDFVSITEEKSNFQIVRK